MNDENTTKATTYRQMKDLGGIPSEAEHAQIHIHVQNPYIPAYPEQNSRGK